MDILFHYLIQPLSKLRDTHHKYIKYLEINVHIVPKIADKFRNADRDSKWGTKRQKIITPKVGLTRLIAYANKSLSRRRLS
jgi:hypothetical protein